MDKRESKTYAELGVSSSKSGVLKAVGAGETSAFFCELREDAAGDPAYYSLLHADGAGTKSIPAYLAYRETGDVSWLAGLAQDSLVMNLDDTACVGAFESLMLSNTIGRNRLLVPDEAVAAIIRRYRETAELLAAHGVAIELCGGETADLGDVVRTLVVDSTLFARVRRDGAISADRIAAGDIIIGLSSSGQAAYEKTPNSGIGSNGLTLARHALISARYAERYPEICDPGLRKEDTYRGRHDLFEEPAGLGTSIAQALLAPTRSYAPVIKRLQAELPGGLHGVIHCTGGGQTKILRFGRGKHYVKDALFACPPIFRLIQEGMDVPWAEMYAVFNMGHRMEIVCAERDASTVIAAAAEYKIEARRIGYVEESAGGNTLAIESEFGRFDY